MRETETGPQTLPEEAVRAAALKLGDLFFIPGRTSDVDAARSILAAALPFICEDIAKQIQAEPAPALARGDGLWGMAMDRGADLVRHYRRGAT